MTLANTACKLRKDWKLAVILLSFALLLSSHKHSGAEVKRRSSAVACALGKPYQDLFFDLSSHPCAHGSKAAGSDMSMARYQRLLVLVHVLVVDDASDE